MTTHDQTVQQQFDPRAQAYVASAFHAAGPDLAWVRARLKAGDWRGRRALDVGTGGGHLAFALQEAGLAVTAVDPSPGMLAAVRAEAARRGTGTPDTVTASAARLPFEDAYFDLVATRYSAHHWLDMRAALAEMRRVTRPGGAVLVIDLLGEDLPLVDTHLQAIELLRDASHVRDYTLAQWRALLEEAALQPEAEAIWPGRIEYAPWIARMRTPPEAQAAIRLIHAHMPAEARAGLQLGEDGSFSVRTGLFWTRRKA